MTDAGQNPKIPWWVSYWTGPTTTRSSLRQEGCFFFLMAAASVGIGIVYHFWRPARMGVIVLPVAFVVLPLGFTIAGLWTMVAVGWIDRHQAWDRVTTRQEREAYQESHSSMVRSLQWGLPSLVAGGAAGALLGWIWETEIGIPVGVALGALAGFMLGAFFGGIIKGVRSSAEKSTEVTSQDTPGNQ